MLKTKKKESEKSSIIVEELKKEEVGEESRNPACSGALRNK